MATNNSINLSDAGIPTYDGAGAFTASTVTAGAVLLGGASNAITDTGVLAKGVLLVGDGSGAPTELTVGTDDHVLTADSGQGSGVKWAAAGGGSATKEFFFMVEPSTSLDNFSIYSMTSSGSQEAQFLVPSDFTTLTAAVALVIPDATETIQWDMRASVAASGQAYDADDRTINDNTLAVTVDLMTELDVSGVLTGLVAGDYVGLRFLSDTSNIRLLGYRIKYT